MSQPPIKSDLYSEVTHLPAKQRPRARPRAPAMSSLAPHVQRHRSQVLKAYRDLVDVVGRSRPISERATKLEEARCAIRANAGESDELKQQAGPGRCCHPRHRTPFNSTNQGSNAYRQRGGRQAWQISLVAS